MGVLHEHARSVANVNSGFQMLTEALDRLRSIDGNIAQLLRVYSDRTRNAIGEGALPLYFTIGPAGITVPAGTQGANRQNPVLDANSRRRGLTLINGSPTGGPNIYLGLGQLSPAVGQGLMLPPQSSWDGRIGNLIWTGLVSAVASSAGAVLTGIEA